NGQRRVVEGGDRLRLAVVTHFEIVFGQGRHQPAVAIHHGDEDTDEIGPAAERGLLRRGRAKETYQTYDHGSADEGPHHHTHSRLVHRPAVQLTHKMYGIAIFFVSRDEVANAYAAQDVGGRRFAGGQSARRASQRRAGRRAHAPLRQRAV